MADNYITKTKNKRKNLQFDRKKEYSRILSLSLINFKSKKDSEIMLEKLESEFSISINLIENEIEKQKFYFHEKLKIKKRTGLVLFKTATNNSHIKNENLPVKINKFNNKLVNTNNKFQDNFHEFIKKFHVLFYSKILDKPMDSLINLMEKVYQFKINKYYKYEDQIKLFQLVEIEENSN